MLWDEHIGMLTYIDAVPMPDGYGRNLVAVPNRWKLILNRVEEFYRASVYVIIQPIEKTEYWVVDCSDKFVNWPHPDYVKAGPFDSLETAKTTCYMMTLTDNRSTNYVS